MLLPRSIVVAIPGLAFVRFIVACAQITYGNFHSLSAYELHASHHILLHLHQLGELFRKVRAKGAGSRFTECMTCTSSKRIEVSLRYLIQQLHGMRIFQLGA